MLTALVAAVALIVGTAVGWSSHSWRLRSKAPRTTDPPLEHDDYLNRWSRSHVAYTDSIKEYDRLVTWASGGALVLSVTLLDMGPSVPASRPWLLAGWGGLTLALLCSLASQYASSRLHSWRLGALTHEQVLTEDRDAKWIAKSANQQAALAFLGPLTKCLTIISGVLLIGGLMGLAGFAYVNAEFGDQAMAAATRAASAIAVAPTKVITELEKKGSEDHQPARRPTTTNDDHGPEDRGEEEVADEVAPRTSMPLSHYALDTFVSQKLSKLTDYAPQSLAAEYPERTSWIIQFILLRIFHNHVSEDRAVLAFYLVRRADAALDERELACDGRAAASRSNQA